MTIITQELVKEYFDYNPDTGDLIWKKPRYKVRAGQKAGCIDPGVGYHHIGFFRKTYRAHRIIWLYVYGEWPKHEIDHINHDKSDNRLSNLRVVTPSGNQKNRTLSKNNTSGASGVDWCSRHKKWRARVSAKGKWNIHLGLFINKEDAIAARKEAEKRYGYHPNDGKPGV